MVERQEKVLKFVSEFMKISFWEFISEAGGRHRASKGSEQGEVERGAKEKRTTREERQEIRDETRERERDNKDNTKRG